MGSKSAKAYAANQIETGVTAADSSQLVILVYEHLFDHLKIGKNELEEGRYGIESFTKATELIQQGLLACLDYKQGSDVAQNLGAIYEWALRELINARVNRSPEKVQEIIDVLNPLYEAWLALAPKEPIQTLKPLPADQSLMVLRPAAA